MPNHSPAPWVVLPTIGTQPWRVIFAPNAAKEQRGIMHVDPSVGGNYDDPRQVGVLRGEHNDTPIEVTEANAHLIAAAPDMLALLTRAKDSISGFVGAVGDMTDCTDDVDLLGEIDALVAKAKGEA